MIEEKKPNIFNIIMKMKPIKIRRKELKAIKKQRDFNEAHGFYIQPCMYLTQEYVKKILAKYKKKKS